MTPEQMELVHSSFAVFYPSAYDRFAEDFYRRLFALDPAIAALFPPELKAQRLKLMTTFNLAVNGLRHPATLAPMLGKLGQLHEQAGVEQAHYETLGFALLETIEQYLGPQFTPEVSAAWSAAYGVIAMLMQATPDAVAPP